MRNRWWIAAASLTAALVGSGAINVFAFAVFLKPVANDLGVGRGVLLLRALDEHTMISPLVVWRLARFLTAFEFEQLSRLLLRSTPRALVHCRFFDRLCRSSTSCLGFPGFSVADKPL